MAKIEMTLEIGRKIKEWRLQYNVKSKDLAEHINKSPAYISKLEKGDIKQIENTLFKDIIVYISGNPNGYEKFMAKVTEDISSDELDKNTLFLNFDKIERKIPIPETLVDFINLKMSILNIDSDKICEYINKNEDLDEEFIKEHSIVKENTPLNRWIAYSTFDPQGNEVKRNYIFINCKAEKLIKILSRELDRCNYTFMFAVIYHILKIENYGNCQVIDKEKYKEETNRILLSNKFYSLYDKNKFGEQSNTVKEYEELLSDFDRENRVLINDLLRLISAMSDYDVKYANDKLSKIVQNTKSETSFSLSFMALSLNPLKNVSVVLKKEFLEKVEDLIQSYKEMPDSKIEKY
jgi:transcriptional regulator with XRE-family HTH domain